MLLTSNGITLDVESPAEIARYKALGYKEVVTPKPEVIPEASVETPEEKPVKGKGKVKDVTRN